MEIHLNSYMGIMNYSKMFTSLRIKKSISNLVSALPLI